MIKLGNVVELIESAYRPEASDEAWLKNVTSAVATVAGSQRALAFRYSTTADWIASGAFALHGFGSEFARDFLNVGGPPEAGQAMARLFLSLRLASLRELAQSPQFAALGSVLDRHGVDDLLGVNGLDPSGRGCMLTVAVARERLSPRTTHLWHRLAAHISAGNRLRTVLEKLAAESSADLTAHAEAILSPAGKVEHASGPAEPRAARDALRDALVRIDAARAERSDPERSVALWRGLVAGRWSLVEHFERDGRRYYLAHKNDPELAPDRTLTAQERVVLGYAELGHSNKLISYELGLAPSTISTTLNRAKKKLGISQR